MLRLLFFGLGGGGTVEEITGAFAVRTVGRTGRFRFRFRFGLGFGLGFGTGFGTGLGAGFRLRLGAGLGLFFRLVLFRFLFVLRIFLIDIRFIIRVFVGLGAVGGRLRVAVIAFITLVCIEFTICRHIKYTVLFLTLSRRVLAEGGHCIAESFRNVLLQLDYHNQHQISKRSIRSASVWSGPWPEASSCPSKCSCPLH